MENSELVAYIKAFVNGQTDKDKANVFVRNLVEKAQEKSIKNELVAQVLASAQQYTIEFVSEKINGIIDSVDASNINSLLNGYLRVIPSLFGETYECTILYLGSPRTQEIDGNKNTVQSVVLYAKGTLYKTSLWNEAVKAFANVKVGEHYRVRGNINNDKFYLTNTPPTPVANGTSQKFNADEIYEIAKKSYTEIKSFSDVLAAVNDKKGKLFRAFVNDVQNRSKVDILNVTIYSNSDLLQDRAILVMSDKNSGYVPLDDVIVAGAVSERQDSPEIVVWPDFVLLSKRRAETPKKEGEERRYY